MVEVFIIACYGDTLHHIGLSGLRGSISVVTNSTYLVLAPTAANPMSLFTYSTCNVIFTILAPKNTIEVVKIKYELVRSLLNKTIECLKVPTEGW